MLTTERLSANEENTEVIKDQLAVTIAFPDYSQQEGKLMSETMEATLSSCEDTWEAPQPEQVTDEEQFPTGVTNPEAHLESDDYKGKLETVQKHSAESELIDAFPDDQREPPAEIVLPVPAQVTDYTEEVTSVSGGALISSSEAGEETEEQAVISEISVSETAEVLETDQDACDTGAWVTHSGAPCESSEPGEAPLSASSNLDCQTLLPD